jgi:hypothetical protein
LADKWWDAFPVHDNTEDSFSFGQNGNVVTAVVAKRADLLSLRTELNGKNRADRSIVTETPYYRFKPFLPDRPCVVHIPQKIVLGPGMEAAFCCRLPVAIYLENSLSLSGADGPRVDPEFALEVYTPVLKDTFFGSDTTQGSLLYALTDAADLLDCAKLYKIDAGKYLRDESDSLREGLFSSTFFILRNDSKHEYETSSVVLHPESMCIYAKGNALTTDIEIISYSGHDEQNNVPSFSVSQSIPLGFKKLTDSSEEGIGTRILKTGADIIRDITSMR